MEKLKVTTIGGGSSYTPEYVEGIIKRYDEFPVTELWLVDVEEGKEKLNIVGELAKRMITKAGLPIEVYLTLNLDEALEGATFVTTQIRVGQLKARENDERIPLSHGMIGQETNGAGGLMCALRTIPVILDIAEKISRLCPDAWMINFTNPVGILTQAMSLYSKHRKFIGVCNVPINMEKGMSEAMNVDHKDVRIDFAGLNHFVYGYNVFHKGNDVTKQALIDLKTANLTMRNIKDLQWDPEFVEALGLVPCPYHRYFYKREEMLKDELEDFKQHKTRAERVVGIEGELFGLYENESLDVKPPQLEERGGAYYSDAACNLMASIYNDKNDIQTVNTINRGTIKDFREEDGIEMSCYIGKDGPIPTGFIDHFPEQVAGLMQMMKQFERLVVKAAIGHNYSDALIALVSNPLVFNDVDGRIVLDELLEANKMYLKGFEKEQE